MALAAGSRLGPYEVVAALGAGGMGEVYQARDTRLDRTVAIKVLPAELSADPERRARFEREARTIAALNHPHICTLHDIGQHDGTTYLVMEHLAGQTLAQRLRKAPLPIAEALEIGAQIAEALDAAHKQGIVHRDLKPSNVMLAMGGAGRSGTGSVKLLDFGLAKLRETAEHPRANASEPTATEPLTQAGEVLGTRPYMAPEQLEGKATDARTDLWALGCVLYEMLTGRPAFTGDSAASITAAILTQEPEPVTTRQPLTPPDLERLVTRCLAKDPDHRWDSAHDVADDLRWIAQPAQAARRSSARAGTRPARRWLLLGALAIVAFTAAGAALWRLGGWGPTRVAERPAITSVAVLPLANLSGNPDQEYFADGLTDSLINELAQIRSLRVISRTSVMQFKDTRTPIREIAQALNNVGAIVEGTVLREGGRVAVTVQLIDAGSDALLWNQSYEREMADILMLRREIAQAVAREIRAVVEPAEAERLRHRDLSNPEAYDQLMFARQLQAVGDTEANLRTSLAAVERAISLDDRMAEAYAESARVNALLWWYGFDRGPARVSTAREAASRAVALDPRLAEAHWAKGLVLYHLDLNHEEALREFLIALEGRPSDSRVLNYIGFIKRRQGHVVEAVTYQKRAVALDPLNASSLFNLGQSYAFLRQTDEAERQFDAALRLSPAYRFAFGYKIRWRLRIRPDLNGAAAVERQAEAVGLGADAYVLYHRVLLHHFAGDGHRALTLLQGFGQDAFSEHSFFVPVALLEGWIRRSLGQRERARDDFARARHVAEAKLAEDPTDSRAQSALGLALAGLGDKAAAIRAGEAATDTMPVTKDAYRGAYRLEDLARIYAAVGERDKAVDILTRLPAMPTDLAGPALVIDPAWAPLRGHPGFERLTQAGFQD